MAMEGAAMATAAVRRDHGRRDGGNGPTVLG